jgi:hypothetical protein
VLAPPPALNNTALPRNTAPHPTLTENRNRAAGSYNTPTLSSARTRGLVRFPARFG